MLLAALAPAFGGVAAGQAAFALFVVVLVNLGQPVGWEVGLVRLEAVTLGVTISVVASVLLWPAGAGRMFALSLASLSRAASADVGSISPPGASRLTRSASTEARRRADAAYDDLIRSRRGKSLPGEVGARLLAVAGVAGMGADLFTIHEPERDASAAPGGLAMVVQGRFSAAASLGAVADTAAGMAPRVVIPPPVTDEVAEVLARAATVGEAETEAVVRAMWALGWLREVEQASERARPSARQVAELAARPWWR